MALVSVPRRFFSPVYVVIAVFLVIILLNLTFQGTGIPKKYLSASPVLGSHTESEVPQKFLDELMAIVEKSKEHDLLDKLQKDVKEKGTDKFMEDLLGQMASSGDSSRTKEDSPTPLEDPSKEPATMPSKQPFVEAANPEPKVDKEKSYTFEVFNEHKLSLKLYDDYKSEYIKSNLENIKSSAILEAVKGLKIEGLPADFADTAAKELHKTFDPRAWYSHMIKEYLVKFAPSVAGLTKEEIGTPLSGTYFKDVQGSPISKEKLTKDRIKLPKEKFDDLQKKHDGLVEALKRLDDPPKEFVNGDGIVISGGGVYFGSALVAVGQLREMGSVLPIEVIMNSVEEYDKQICEELLPKQFNARCIVIEEQIGKELLESLKLTKFQLKIFGLLFSTFNNIITIDADNMPVKNVDDLFHSEPYLSSKFILWPDIWHRQIAPVYYDLARFDVGEYPVRRSGIANDADFKEYVVKDKDTGVFLHDLDGVPDAISIESGQMVFSKRSHFKAFMLALYYNMNGPDFFYYLFFQGAPGEGDRETFVPALHLFKETYHVVERDVWLAGYKRENGDFQESTLVQHSPSETVEFMNDWKKWLVEKKLDPRLWPFQSGTYTNKLMDEFKNTKEKELSTPCKFPSIQFMHIHNPKINPISNTGIYERRYLGLPGEYDSFGKTDWELKFHSIAKWIACKGITSPTFWENAKVSQKDSCERVTKFVDFLLLDTKNAASGELKYLL